MSDVKMKSGMVSLMCAAVLAGCTGDYERAKAGADYEVLLLGLSTEEIRACAGEPEAIRTANGQERWQYSYEAFRRGYYDKDYVGITRVVFVGGEVTEIIYGANYTRDGIGLPLSKTAYRNFNAPIFEQC